MSGKNPIIDLKTKKMRHRRWTTIGTVALGALAFGLPFLYIESRRSKENLFLKTGPLSPTEKMRGPYMNISGRDSGKDPNWQANNQR